MKPKKLKVAPPRNPYALAARTKGAAAGTHEKGPRAVRRQEAQRLREVIRSRDPDGVIERASRHRKV